MTDASWSVLPGDALRRLQEAYEPVWMVWFVPCWDGSKHWLTWCAKRHADRALVHASRPEHLAEYIEAVNAEARALRDAHADGAGMTARTPACP